jgi:non-heme chloroperoxidase
MGQTPGPWRDPSPHQVRFVTVDKDVQLEVLDWGGSGRPIVLLAGSGNSAHVFDEFALKLADCCRVYAVTRRGHGLSSTPPSGYDEQRLADDVWQVLVQERIEKPVIVGHSAAGVEITALARQHSARLAGLVYLDALGDLEDDPPADKEWLALQQQLPPGLSPAPVCDPMDRSTFEAYQASLACRYQFTLPLSEVHSMFEDVGGRPGAGRFPDWASRAMGQGQPVRRDYSNIRVPVLALMNFAPETERLLADSGYQPKNQAERAAIDRFMARSRIVFARFTDKLTRAVPDARVVHLGFVGHYVFITREAEVLREIRAFLDGVERR